MRVLRMTQSSVLMCQSCASKRDAGKRQNHRPNVNTNPELSRTWFCLLLYSELRCANTMAPYVVTSEELRRSSLLIRPCWNATPLHR
jgi:hypothetical protein